MSATDSNTEGPHPGSELNAANPAQIAADFETVSGTPESRNPQDTPAGHSRMVIVDPANPSTEVLREAAEVIRRGGLVAFPTETVYGLGAHALDVEATSRVFSVKGRPSTDPLIVHVVSVGQARKLTRTWDDRAEQLAQRFWPGPLTMVLPKGNVVPDDITAGRDTVAIRIPAHPIALGLLRESGVAIAAPSANRFGRISPTSAGDVAEELAGGYDLLLDGGPTLVGVESTVIDLTGDTAVVLRPGGVTVEDLESVIGKIVVLKRQSHAEDRDALAPGQFLRHYSPSTPLVAMDAPASVMDALAQRLRADGVTVGLIELPQRPADAARVLYSRLRAHDGTADLLIIRTMADGGIGDAVNDRIFRAAQGNVISSASDEVTGRLLNLIGR